MSKQTPSSTVRTARSIFTLTGAVIGLTGIQMQLQATAQLSGKGAVIGTLEQTELGIAVRETVLAAAPQAHSGGAVLAFGMLMMLVGFGVHAWYYVPKQADAPVPVRIRKQGTKKTQAKKSARNSRRQADVIWIERTIRF